MSENTVKSRIIDGHIICGHCGYTKALHKCGVGVFLQEDIRYSEQCRVLVGKCPECDAELHYPMNNVPNVGYEPAASFS